VQATLATKLRLTPQARCDPKTIGRQQQRGYPAPWEWEKNDIRGKGGALD
jgi:hypothetical protein